VVQDQPAMPELTTSITGNDQSISVNDLPASAFTGNCEIAK